MPIIGLFPRSESVIRHYRLHRRLAEAIDARAKESKVTNTELVNYTLAARFAPEILPQMDSFKSKPRYKFPNRKTGNRYTV